MVGFRKAGASVLVGSVAGLVVMLVLTPILTRLVSPEEFGKFALIAAVASIFVGFSTGRMEVFSLTAEVEVEARARLAAAFCLACVFSFVLTVCGLFGWFLYSWPWEAILIGALVLAGSVQLIGTAALTRSRLYGRLGAHNFAQNAGLGSAQIVGALISPTVAPLILAFLLSKMTWLPALVDRLNFKAVKSSLRSTRAQSSRASVSALVNSLASQVLIIVPGVLLGTVFAASFAMAIRLIISPLSMVGQAAGAAAVGEVSKAVRSGDMSGAALIFRSGVRDLAVIAVLPCTFLLFFGSVAIPWILGNEWAATGNVVAGLSLGAWAQFSVAPFSQLLNLLNQSRRLMQWDILRLILYLGAFIVPFLAGTSAQYIPWILSFAMGACYLWLYVICAQALRQPKATTR